MSINGTRQLERPSHAPAWFTVAACVSLGLLIVAGLAGALGLG